MVNDESTLDIVFHALANRARRSMLDRLAGGSATVGELARPLSMSKPAVSKHLRVLEDAGLVVRRRHGRVHRIHVRHDRLRQAGTWLEERADMWNAAFDELERLLEEK